MSQIRFASFAAFLVILSLGPCAYGQVGGLTDQTTTPIPGVGHDYIKMLNETVSPANGSVSLRISIPTPPGRKLSLPFSFAYDSSGAWFLQQSVVLTGHPVIAYTNIAPFALGAWSFTLPQLTDHVLLFTPSSPTNDGFPVCTGTGGYIFTDLAGSRHELRLSNIAGMFKPTNHTQETLSCAESSWSQFTSGGDGLVQAVLNNPLQFDANASQPIVPLSEPNIVPAEKDDGSPQIVDADGTVYNFPVTPGNGWGCAHWHDSNNQYFTSGFPASIEDRNGNVINITSGQSGINWCYPGGSYTVAGTDTLGRTLFSASNFGASSSTVSVAGLANPYTLTWGTAPSGQGIAINSQTIVANGVCTPMPSHAAGSAIVVTAITLPSGGNYAFSYDVSGSGYLAKMTYPFNGYISYQWGVNPLSAYITYSNTAGASNQCQFYYDTPAISHRYVSYDGNTIALQQDFAYTTTWSTSNPTAWTAKTTTVTTHDLVRGTTFQTKYTYSPYLQQSAPNVSSGAQYLPVERTITMFDTSGNVLKTVTKNMGGLFSPILLCELDTLDNGLVAGAYYSYTTGMLLADKKEYDFGQFSAASACSNSSIPPQNITPARETTTSYQTFSATPIYPSGVSIFDKPSSVKTYGATGTLVAETDYSYDQGGTISASTPSGTHDEVNYSASSAAPRGNATTVTKQCFNCTNAVTRYTYDETGQMLSATDPKGNQTQYSYLDNFDSPPSSGTNSYLTKITQPSTNGVAHIESFKYAYSDGQLISSTDQNNLSTNYVYNDSFRRLTEIDYPDGGKTTYTYNDAPYNPSTPSPSVLTSRAMNATTNVSLLSAMDGLGHVIGTAATDPDCASGDKISSVYDGLGRLYTVTNRYCTTSDSTYGVTMFLYDALGRTTQVTNPDSSTVLTTYKGPVTQVQDEGNGNGTQRVTRISQTDGLDRLTTVCEVAPGPFVGAGGASSSSLIGSNGTPANCGLAISGTGFLTTYQYDALDNLLQVNQAGVAARTFAYDSLSRLTSATNPESGAISYTYDANSNVATRIAPAPNQAGSATVTTTYQYDTLNRLLTKSYSDGTTISPNFYYDVPPSWAGPRQNAIGRMTVFSTVACLFTALDYDQLGRVTGRYTNFPRPDGSCGGGNPRNYTYDLAGNLTSETDGAFQTRGYNYNSAGRLTSVTASGRTGWYIPPTLVSGMHYNALGEVISDTLLTVGSTATESRTFTNRGWLQSSSTIYNVNSPIYSLSLTHAPNGAVTAANDSANGNWAYGYDAFNRLVCANLSNGTCASPTNGQPTYNYVYDRFGNRWQQNGPHSMQLSFSSSNNRMDGYSYDAAGNVLNDGTHSYTYDAENRIVKVDSGNTATYVYDGEGHSVQKTISASNNQGEAPGTWDFLYDLSGRLITEMNGGNGGPVFWRGEVYAGSRHLATLAGDTYYDEQDQVGSDRARFTVDHNTFQLYNNTSTSLPFGDWLTWSGSSNSAINFTGQRRDPESGLDDFGARYFGSSLGRFMTPDWSAKPQSVPYAVLGDPQSLNLYAYVRNNPLSRVDADGHYELNASGCGDNAKCQKKWEKAANKFEARREKNLQSKKADVRAAAAAYGERGEANGVNVGFANLASQGINGSVDPKGSAGGNPLIQVTLDFGRAGNSETITHEGTHVGDDTRFLNSFNPLTGGYDQGLNPTHGETEFNSFKAGAEISREHGFGPNEDQKIWNFLRTSPTYGPNLNTPVFDPTRFPAGGAPPNVPLPGALDNEED